LSNGSRRSGSSSGTVEAAVAVDLDFDEQDEFDDFVNASEVDVDTSVADDDEEVDILPPARAQGTASSTFRVIKLLFIIAALAAILWSVANNGANIPKQLTGGDQPALPGAEL